MKKSSFFYTQLIIPFVREQAAATTATPADDQRSEDVGRCEAGGRGAIAQRSVAAVANTNGTEDERLLKTFATSGVSALAIAAKILSTAGRKIGAESAGRRQRPKQRYTLVYSHRIGGKH